MRQQPGYVDSSTFLAWLSESILATKSIVDAFWSIHVGEEVFVPNLEWIGLYCGLSLATRLDVLAARRPFQTATRHLRQLSDIQLTLRQAILRLESASNNLESNNDDALSYFTLRAKRLETWYIGHALGSAGHADAIDANVEASTTTYTANDCEDNSFQEPDENTCVGMVEDYSVSNILSTLGPNIDFGGCLFSATQPLYDDGSYSFE